MEITAKEGEIQRTIRSFARNKRLKGKIVKIMFQTVEWMGKHLKDPEPQGYKKLTEYALLHGSIKRVE